MRIWGARIFSKSFGGKIVEVWTAFYHGKILFMQKIE